MFGSRIKIVWEEQLVEPPIHYLTCLIVPLSSVKNNLKRFHDKGLYKKDTPAPRVGVSDDLDKNDDLMRPNDAKMT